MIKMKITKPPPSIITIINRPLAAKLNANEIEPQYSPPHPATVAVAAAAASPSSSFTPLHRRAVAAAIKCVHTSYELPSHGSGGGVEKNDGGWREEEVAGRGEGMGGVEQRVRVRQERTRQKREPSALLTVGRWLYVLSAVEECERVVAAACVEGRGAGKGQGETGERGLVKLLAKCRARRELV